MDYFPCLYCVLFITFQLCTLQPLSSILWGQLAESIILFKVSCRSKEFFPLLISHVTFIFFICLFIWFYIIDSQTLFNSILGLPIGSTKYIFFQASYLPVFHCLLSELGSISLSIFVCSHNIELNNIWELVLKEKKKKGLIKIF